jgi:hypothetical protein
MIENYNARNLGRPAFVSKGLGIPFGVLLQKTGGLWPRLVGSPPISYWESAVAGSDPFKWRYYQGEIILLCVRWYLRYALSYRDLGEMMR